MYVCVSACELHIYVLIYLLAIKHTGSTTSIINTISKRDHQGDTAFIIVIINVIIMYYMKLCQNAESIQYLKVCEDER